MKNSLRPISLILCALFVAAPAFAGGAAMSDTATPLCDEHGKEGENKQDKKDETKKDEDKNQPKPSAF